MKYFSNRSSIWQPYFFVFLFSTLFCCQYIYLSGSEVLNKYPFISPDGYEWYTNGLYLLERAWPQNDMGLPIIPVLRPPVYVVINAIDFLIPTSGIILALIQALSIFLTFHFSVMLYREFILKPDHETNIDLWCLALGFTLMPINFFKPYLLSDSFATCLSLGSIVLLVRFFKHQKKSLLAWSSMVATIAALTQTYGYIPFCIFLSLFIIQKYRSISPANLLKVLGALTLPVLIYVIVHYLWRKFIPHLMTPDNFLLLSFSIKNWEFYLLIWSIYFWPILVIFLITIFTVKDGRWLFNGPSALYLLVLVYATFCFFYQWKESRFTYYFWPWLLILFLSTRPQLKGGLKCMPIALFLTSIFIFPLNPWDPSAQNIKLSYHNWTYQYFTSKPISRNLNQCVPHCPINDLCKPSCEDHEYFQDFSHHGIGKTLSTYLFLNQIRR